MLSSKERAELRGKANLLDTTLIVGKGGISDELIAETEILLNSHELVKGKVLENSLLSAQEASEEICTRCGADGVQTVGNRFVIYRKKPEESKTPHSKVKKPAAKKKNPVKLGIKQRKLAAEKQRELKNAYFKQQALKASIERSKAKKARSAGTDGYDN